MTDGTFFRTNDLAQAVRVSVQQVRNLEAAGFLPRVERSPTGYRRYTRRHLAALETTTRLIAGYGWQRAQRIMQAIHRGALADALALIDERHAELAGARQQLAQTLAALSVLAAQSPLETRPLVSTPEYLYVGAAARLVGVRVSALRHWEGQGVLRPTREPGSRYRRYDGRQLRRLRVVALLRQANYDFAAIHTVLDELERGRPERAIAAVERRRAALTEESRRCLAAIAALHAYLRDFPESV